MKIRVEVTGLDDVKESLRRLGAAGVPASKKVLSDFTKRVVPRARDLAPVDEGPGGGDLRDSVRASRPTVTKRGVVSAGVVAGGLVLQRLPADRDPGSYAVQQHEDLTLKHTKGGPKFVERPFFQLIGEVPDQLLGELDKVPK